jgi:uncharacterized protein YeaO (DUF488 family)
MTSVRCQRVADRRGVPPGPGELVVLVDRLWPRGVPKADLRGHEWDKDVAPSTELRRWFHAWPDSEREERFPEFADRYRAELDGSTAAAVDALAERAREHATLTLLYGLKDTAHNHAQLLAEVLRERLKRLER